MADSLSTTVAAAKHACGVMSWGKSYEATREQLTTYRRTAREELGSEEAARGRLAIMRPVYVAETEAEAEAVVRPSVNLLLDHLLGLTPAWDSRKAFLATDEELTDRDLELDWYDFLNERGWCLVGTAEQVTEKLKRFESELGVEHFCAYWAMPLIRFDQMVASTKRFADRVMPNF
jgi:alkanesulfonate monooxygenase SsuD/methylene tetrahydromethanopterin reductase-like flavin-dependent oxidoreductase (luciferase family)